MHECVHVHCTGETYTLQVWQILSVAWLDLRYGLIVVRLTKNDVAVGPCSRPLKRGNGFITQSSWVFHFRQTTKNG